jgi:hypothetical protein
MLNMYTSEVYEGMMEASAKLVHSSAIDFSFECWLLNVFVILPFVLYERDNWFLPPTKERRLKVHKNKCYEEILGLKKENIREKKLQEEEWDESGM